MDSKKERRIAYVVLVVAFLVGTVSMVSFAGKTPEEPVRILFQTNAGRVIFDHQVHAAGDGYGLDCQGCHHAATVGTGPVDTAEVCWKCHDFDDDTYNMENFNHIGHYEEYAQDCLECHGERDFDPQALRACTSCHKPGEAGFARKADDAAHAQCIGCHEDKGAGPGEGPEACGLCHVM
ncbi:MAG: cytochrome c3 family protein [Pseudomonadota bacterium]